MISKFNQGWWNCFNSFTDEILEANPNSFIPGKVLDGAGVDIKEIRQVIRYHGVSEATERYLNDYANKKVYDKSKLC